MKNLFLVLLAVLAFSGVCVVYGAGADNQRWDFTQKYSQAFRNQAVSMQYVPGSETYFAGGVNIIYATSRITVKMDASSGGYNSSMQLNDKYGKVYTSGKSGALRKDDVATDKITINTAFASYFYGYVDYRGSSTSPNIYTCTLTQ